MIRTCGALLACFFACFFMLIQPVHALEDAEQEILAEQAIRILGGNGNVIARWSQPVRLGLVGFPDQKTIGIAEGILDDIGQITGLPTSVSSWRPATADDYLHELRNSSPYVLAKCATTKTADCPNFVAVLTTPEQMRDIAQAIPLRDVYQQSLDGTQTPKCFFAPFQRAYVDIVQAVVFVNNSLSEAMTRTCLNEEIYQSFGMFSDVTGSQYFSFDNREEPKSITCYDKLLLQAIYSRQFRPGAPAFRVVQQFVRQAVAGRCQ